MSSGAASWSFTEEDFGAITQSLQRFLVREQRALRAARRSQRAARRHRRRAAQFDPTAFASLTAADFSANDQLAKLIGENDFTRCSTRARRSPSTSPTSPGA